MIFKQTIFREANISYQIQGKGQTVVFLHGFGEDSSIWHHVTHKLSQEFQVILIDMPGSGKSDFLQQDQVHINDYAAIVKAVMVKENIHSFILLGHSMGGYVSLAYLEHYPNDLLAIGLIHSTCFADDDNKKTIRTKSIAFIEKNGNRSFLQTSIPVLFYDQHKHQNEIEKLIEQADQFHKKALIQYYRVMMQRPDRSDIIRDCSIPVLIICGAHDKAVPIQYSLQQSHLAKNTHLHILRNTAHMGMLEETAKTTDAIRHFVNELSYRIK